MRRFIIFFSIILFIYGLVNFYIFLKGWYALPTGGSLRIYYSIGFFLAALSFIAGRILERKALSWFSETLTWIGSFWLAWMLYAFLFFILIDVIGFADSFFHSISDYQFHPLAIPGAVAVSASLIIIAGHINARLPRVKYLKLNVDKKIGEMAKLNIIVASDIHIGTIIGRSRIDKIVAMINALDPDIVLLPGDVVDEDLAPVIKENIGESLRNIRSRMGVYSITGNHEFIGGAEAATRYLTEHGITVLRDQFVRINDSFYVIGREDRSVNSFSGRQRKTLTELTSGIDRNLSLILMDHQPFHLDEAESNGIDLQLSGHTHHGQLWPFNFITKKVFEVSWGYKKKGMTHFYVSSGVGTWGPPVRTGNRPEIVSIELKFIRA
jgi:predicted MPP superfamily phosphohydrolase